MMLGVSGQFQHNQPLLTNLCSSTDLFESKQGETPRNEVHMSLVFRVSD